MKKKLISLYCWLWKHDWVICSRFTVQNPDGYIADRSQWGHSECTRCGKTYTWSADS